MKKLLKLFSFGYAGYSVVELLWRGYTHWTMGVTGGVCFSLLYWINGKLGRVGIWWKCAAGSAVITAVEFVVGCIVNKGFKWNVWDYSCFRFHVMGQICPLYSMLWFFLCAPIYFFLNKGRQRRTLFA